MLKDRYIAYKKQRANRNIVHKELDLSDPTHAMTQDDNTNVKSMLLDSQQRIPNFPPVKSPGMSMERRSIASHH